MNHSQTKIQNQAKQKSGHIEVIDFVRALAIIHIFLYHYLLEWFGGSFLITPDGIAKNLEHLQIFHDGGVLGLMKNLFSYLFAYGYSSVNVFLLLSGFVLTYSLLRRQAAGQKQPVKKESWVIFIWKRLKRILIPLYISIILGMIILGLRNVFFPSLSSLPVYGSWDVLKLLLFPLFIFDYRFLQLFNGDLWFIPLILQLYVLFPVLSWLLKKLKPVKFLAITFLITVGYRFLATYGYQLLLPYFKVPLFDAAPMGVIYQSQAGYYGFGFFLPRLFEFTLGMGLAAIHYKSGKLFQRLISVKVFLAGLLLVLSSFALNTVRWGWLFSDAMIAFGLTLLFLNFAHWLTHFELMRKFLKKLGDSAYEVYLLHHYFLNYLLLPFLVLIGMKNEWGFWLFLPVFSVLSIFGGKLGFFLTQCVEKVFNRISRK